jgi:serine/threonine-protein kinase
MTGRTIGKYRIVGQLGRGATGIVYRAVDETLNREVAIKILNPEFANTDIIRRFRAEAMTLARLNHPEIATVYELLASETDLLMVMELVRGETLDKLLNRVGPMPPERAAYVLDKVLSPLEHAHRAGIVHRDMKPANVMVTELGGVKIMDFGIARVRDAEHMTVDGVMMGTPAYMAPEQVLGEEVDGRADLYSVGVIFYRLLTAALPFKADTAVGMLQKQISDSPMSLHVHREGLPDWCETIVQRALAKSPGDRFQTAEEFREALGSAAGMAKTLDVAKAFGVADRQVIMPSQPAVVETVAVSRADAPFVAAPSASAVPVSEAAGVLSPAYGSTGKRRKKRFAWAGSMVAGSAMVVVLAYVVMPRPATDMTAAPAMGIEPLPVPATSALTFETKALVGTGKRQREHDAQLVFADGKITVTAYDTRRVLYSVPYDSVISITHSRGRDPLWISPTGAAPVVRATGGTMGKFGIFVERDWIAVQTDTEDRFVILRSTGTPVRKILAELEEHTGRTSKFATQRK